MLCCVVKRAFKVFIQFSCRWGEWVCHWKCEACSVDFFKLFGFLLIVAIFLKDFWMFGWKFEQIDFQILKENNIFSLLLTLCILMITHHVSTDPLINSQFSFHKPWHKSLKQIFLKFKPQNQLNCDCYRYFSVVKIYYTRR